MPDGVQLIDMGTSVYWADRNIGANSNTSAGNYYSWGETWTQDFYTASGLDYNHNIEWMPENDAATVNWGYPWRTPTKEEFSDLVSQLSSKSFENACIKLVSTNGSWMYFPKSGYATTLHSIPSTPVWNANNVGFMWSSTKIDRNKAYAFRAVFNNSAPEVSADYPADRYVGLPVRPVVNKYHISVTDGDNVTVFRDYPLTSQVAITATPDDCHTFVKWQKKNGETWQDVDGGTNATLNITVSANAEYQAVFSLKTASITLTSDGNGTVEFDD